MINIETIEDVKVLKELIQDNSRMIELEEQVGFLTDTVKTQNKLIKQLSKKEALTAEDVLTIMRKALKEEQKTVVKNVKMPTAKKSKRKRVQSAPSPKDVFVIPKNLKEKDIVKPYNKILLDGNVLIHKTTMNQKRKIPISTVELLYLLESYKSRGNKLLVEDVNFFSKLFDINKVQFCKILYNLGEGTFFNAINSIDDQIKQSNFKYKNGSIHIINKGKTYDTKISAKDFEYMVNVYINDNKPYKVIFNLSKENKKINPIHLLTILRRNTVVSKAITEGS